MLISTKRLDIYLQPLCMQLSSIPRLKVAVLSRAEPGGALSVFRVAGRAAVSILATLEAGEQLAEVIVSNEAWKV